MGFFRRDEKPRGGRPRPSLTASGERLTREKAEENQRLALSWQTRAFVYYDELGCIKYASQFYARMLAPLRLYAAKRDENDDWVEIERDTTDENERKALEALDRIRDPGGGGREDLQAAYGRLMFIAGEAQLFCSEDPDTKMEQWEMLSRDELKTTGNGEYQRVKAPSLSPEEYREPADDDYSPVEGDNAVAYRLWKRHPRFSAWPDAPMRGVLDDCEELLLLSRAVRSRTRSRLASAGLLALSEDFDYSPLEPVPDEDPDEDPFLSDLTAAMMAAVDNESDPSAIVPIVVRGPTEAIEKGIRHIQIVDPTQLYPETGLRHELIERIAIGLDMPPEVLLGLTDANHWTGWQIDEQTWKQHGMPVANQFVGDLNAAYYRAELRSASVEDPERYAIRYDPAPVINHPDKTKDAKELHDRLAVSDEYLREAAGVDEDAAPDEAEMIRRIGVIVRDGSLATTGVPRATDAPGGPSGTGKPSGEPPGPEVEAGPASGGGETDQLPPAPPGDQEPVTASANGNGNGHAVEVARLVGAADLALLRAREVAGNRVVSLAKKNDRARAILEETGVRARDAAAVLGRDLCVEIGAGDARALVEPARTLLLDALRLWRIGGQEAEVIAEQVERHAARTLFDMGPPTPLPRQFAGYLEGVVRTR